MIMSILLELNQGQSTPNTYLKGREVRLHVLRGSVEVSVGDDNVITMDESAKPSMDVSHAQHQISALAPSVLEVHIEPPLPAGENPYAN